MTGPTKIPYAGKDDSEADLLSIEETIFVLWSHPIRMDTLSIARKLNVRESFVANRLAAVRDGRRA